MRRDGSWQQQRVQQASARNKAPLQQASPVAGADLSIMCSAGAALL